MHSLPTLSSIPSPSPSYNQTQSWWSTTLHSATLNHTETIGEVQRPSPYIYQPTIWLVVVAAIAFALATIAHIWFFLHGRTWFFWAMLVGGLMEVAGFVSRAISAQNPDSAYPFVLQYLALILAPSFIAAACYAVFGRIVWWVTPKVERTFRALWCPPRFVTLFFVTFDLGSFFIQLMGASYSARAIQDGTLSAEEKHHRREKGLSTMQVGLLLQLICFLFFAVVGARFIIISRRWAGRPLPYGSPYVQWKHLNWAVNAAATLILIRTIYRVVEFTNRGETPGYVRSHEWLFWALDGFPMLLTFIGLAVFHPIHYLPGELCGFRLDRKKLSKVEKSSPPSYFLSEEIHSRGGHP